MNGSSEWFFLNQKIVKQNIRQQNEMLLRQLEGQILGDSCMGQRATKRDNGEYRCDDYMYDNAQGCTYFCRNTIFPGLSICSYRNRTQE